MKLVLRTLKVNFDKRARGRAGYSEPFSDEIVSMVMVKDRTHKEMFSYLATVESFLFEVDASKAPAAKAKIIKSIEAIGFTVESAPMKGVVGSGRMYAWR